MILVDTGALYALTDKNDKNHRQAKEFADLTQIGPPATISGLGVLDYASFAVDGSNSGDPGTGRLYACCDVLAALVSGAL